MTIKKVLFLEPMADYSVVSNAMIEGKRLEAGKIYLPSLPHREALIDTLSQAHSSSRDKLLTYSTVDQDIDDELYVVCKELAVDLVNIIRSSSLALFGDRNYFIDKDNSQAAIVHLHDNLASFLRKFIDFDKRVSEMETDEIIYVPRPGHHWLAHYSYLQLKYPKLNVGIFKNHWLAGHLTKYSPKSVVKPLSRINKFARRPTLDFSNKIAEPNIFLCTNLVQPRFRDSAIPLLEGLLSKTNVVCYNFGSVIEDDIVEEISAKFANLPYDLTVCQRNVPAKSRVPSQEEIKFLHSVVSRFCKGLSKRGDRYAHFDEVVKTLLYSRVLPFLLDIKEQHKALSKIVQQSNLTVVLPGRSSDALLSTAIAKTYSIPSIEIQSGVVSNSKRFVKPQADEVVAVDPFGKEVYSEFLDFPVEKIKVLGSAKLEYDIGPFRKTSKIEAKKELRNYGVNEKKPIVLLATQPIGVDHAEKIVRIALAGIKPLKRLHLVIKLHPSEDENYHNAYIKIAKELKVKNVSVIKDIPIIPLIVASDFVLTYFSTVGLEAFALNRPVVTINPFESRPSFDLAKMGVSLEVGSGPALTSMLKEYLLKNVPVPVKYPLLERLTDGMAIKRIQEHLIDTAIHHFIVKD